MQELRGACLDARVCRRRSLRAAVGEDAFAKVQVVEGSTSDAQVLEGILREMPGSVAIDTLGNDGRLDLLKTVARLCAAAGVELVAMGGAGILKLPDGQFLWTQVCACTPAFSGFLDKTGHGQASKSPSQIAWAWAFCMVDCPEVKETLFFCAKIR